MNARARLGVTLALVLILISLAVFARPTTPSPAAGPTRPEWEYRTRMLYNWVPTAESQISEQEIRENSITNLQPLLEQAGKGGGELAGTTTISGYPHRNPRIASEKIFVVVKRLRR